ncbi:phage tail protein [Pararobbsia silviterrae]|uniref:Phage tail protein n=1 Tax=Pararobbsia silviterrae TaxID=1792498 RepID=A0A494XZM5_9BURK|nr:phage tail protein [Pararobbsia silviterrae]RKP55967.1 phage tail protein [Pararobbsia silviterrae]
MDNLSLYEPSVSHRFAATFWFGRIPAMDVFDVCFQRIRGLSRDRDVTAYSEGGENQRNTYFANKLRHGSLVLERGVMVATPLTLMFNRQLNGGRVVYFNAVISVIDAVHAPTTNWIVTKAIPVRWQFGDLDAASNQILINTLELRYQDMTLLGVRL